MENVKQFINAKGNAMGETMFLEYNSGFKCGLRDGIHKDTDGYKTKKEEAGAHSFL